MSDPRSTRTWRDVVRPAVLARDGYRCQLCGRLAHEAGHRRALVDGGAPFDLANLEAQCRHCNRADGARIAARRRGVGRSSRRW